MSTEGITFAQSNYYIEEQRTFYGGAVVGANFSQIDGDNFAGYRKIGLNAGGIIYTNIAPKVAASMEILYSQRGARAHKNQVSNTKQYLITDYTIDLHYAEVPLQIHYYDKRKSHFGGGFSYSQLIGSDEKATTSNTAFNDTANLNNFSFRKFDVNFIVGGNLHLVKGLYLNVRFQYSLLPVRTAIHPEFGRAEQYSNMWVMRLMYLFD
ncbi:MAG: porin family protein [Flavipsychrobacter sp.]